MNVQEYYNHFKNNFFSDYIYGNKRLFAQRDFLKKCLPQDIDQVLILGSGIGDLVPFLLKNWKRVRKVVCVDISNESLEVGRILFKDQRVKFIFHDLTGDEEIKGTYDTIIFPDSYEHMPIEARRKIGEAVSKLLSDRGSVYFTVPSKQYQDHLRASGEGLQIIDEDVTVEDFLSISDQVNGDLIYLNYISAWKRHDYLHAVVQRKPKTIQELGVRSYSVAEAGATFGLTKFECLRRFCYYNRLATIWRRLKLRSIFQKLK